jgi:hypothetical protein
MVQLQRRFFNHVSVVQHESFGIGRQRRQERVPLMLHIGISNAFKLAPDDHIQYVGIVY